MAYSHVAQLICTSSIQLPSWDFHAVFADNSSSFLPWQILCLLDPTSSFLILASHLIIWTEILYRYCYFDLTFKKYFILSPTLFFCYWGIQYDCFLFFVYDQLFLFILLFWYCVLLWSFFSLALFFLWFFLHGFCSCFIDAICNICSSFLSILFKVLKQVHAFRIVLFFTDFFFQVCSRVFFVFVLVSTFMLKAFINVLCSSPLIFEIDIANSVYVRTELGQELADWHT